MAADRVTFRRPSEEFVRQQERVFRASLEDTTDPLLVDEAVVHPELVRLSLRPKPGPRQPG